MYGKVLKNSIKTVILKEDIVNFIQIKAKKIDELYVTRFLWEYNKAYICKSKLDTIELPFYYTKHDLCREYYYEKE